MTHSRFPYNSEVAYCNTCQKLEPMSNYQPCSCYVCITDLANGVSEYEDESNQSYTTYGDFMTVSMLKDALSMIPNHARVQGVIGYKINAGKVTLIMAEGGGE